MPSALENLIKILKLERQQGYKNNAVIGGLGAFSANWSERAHTQARRPEHHKLVEEIETLLHSYEQVEGKSNRHDSVTYMMDRIMGRIPPPPEYQVTEADLQKYPPNDKLKIVPRREQQQERQKRPTRDVTSADKSTEQSVSDKQDESNIQEHQNQRTSSRPKQREPRQTRKQAEPRRKSDNRRKETSNNRQSDRQNIEENTEYEDRLIYGLPSQPQGNDLPEQPRLVRPPRQPRPQIAPEEATDILRGLKAPVSKVKGVGPSMQKSLDKLGLETINDLLFFLPRRYDDYTRLDYISKLKPETVVTVIGTVCRAEVRKGRNNRQDFYMEVDDGSGVLSVKFFGQHFLIRTIRKGKQVVLSGKISIYGNQLQMINPEWEQLDSDNLHTIGIVPVYPLTEGLGERKLRRLMKETVEYWAERIPDYMPEIVLERAELGDLGWALKNLHFPEGQDHLHHAQRRYVFDQLLTLQLAILANRREWQSVPSQPIQVDDGFLENFVDAVFPYPLTGAQTRAIADIRRDIITDKPMNRLLQGDVGAGKTAVAITALAMAFNDNKQSALMAPTSILAEQHYQGIKATFDKIESERKPVIALLTGSITNFDREAIYRGMTDGSIDIVIGTHALIQSGVEFHNLGLAIIDEQHRFGVEQRGTLRGKGNNPHLLVMTATPIPRTLALTLYADLDLSIMDEMPPGRIPVNTRVVEPIARERIYSFVEAELDKGRQAFIVYPLVEASDNVEAESAVEAFEHLSKVFFRYRVGLLHGRMKPSEKDDIMAAFRDHEFDVLVTTSVAEVGVDIPNASVIVMEGANRFGLAQLHQFRGRVGRGGHASYCLLIPDKDTPEARQRLEVLEATTDGFKLAEEDWKLRGPGDLVGTRQSGQSLLKLAEAITPDLVQLAQHESRTIFDEDAELALPEHRLLAQRVAMLYNEDSDVS